VNLKLR
jgi:hypothetical protein